MLSHSLPFTYNGGPRLRLVSAILHICKWNLFFDGTFFRPFFKGELIKLKPKFRHMLIWVVWSKCFGEIWRLIGQKEALAGLKALEGTSQGYNTSLGLTIELCSINLGHAGELRLVNFIKKIMQINFPKTAKLNSCHYLSRRL